MKVYKREDWYWFVGGDRSQVFSSSRMAMVALTDSGYEDFLDSGGVTSTTSANDMLLTQIEILEASVSVRMLQEQAAGSTNTFSGGPYAGKTSAQAIAEIVARKDTLRAELT